MKCLHQSLCSACSIAVLACGSDNGPLFDDLPLQVTSSMEESAIIIHRGSAGDSPSLGPEVRRAPPRAAEGEGPLIYLGSKEQRPRSAPEVASPASDISQALTGVGNAATADSAVDGGTPAPNRASSADSGNDGGGPQLPLRGFTFDLGIDGWFFEYAEPASLLGSPFAQALAEGDVSAARAEPENVATAVHDTAVGDPEDGSVLLELPFSGPAQKVFFGANVAEGATGMDLAGKSISVRVRLLGAVGQVVNPAGLKIYVRTGPTLAYADSPFSGISRDTGWQTFTWSNVSIPVYVDPPGTHAPADVRQIGVEFDSGEGAPYGPVALHLDSVTF